MKMEWALLDRISNIINIKDVLHVSDLAYNLFLINQATRKDFEIIFVDDDYYIRKNSILIENAPKIQNIYIFSLLESTTKIVRIIQKNMKTLSINLILNEDAVEL